MTMIECGEHSGDVEEADHCHGAICKNENGWRWRVLWFRGGETLPAKSTVRK